MKKKIAILGATGSIGTTALEIIRKYPDKFEVYLLANDKNLVRLEQLIKEFKPRYAINISNEKLYVNGISEKYDGSLIYNPEIYKNADITVNGIAGLAGLRSTIAVLRSGGRLATANKESLVAAGKLVISEKNRNNAEILPLDSEHSTIWQCIGNNINNVKSIILTASGGAFRDYNYEELKNAKARDALRHPNWKMGKKVTVDCATLMNKGMEIIEAKHLFGIDNIETIMHRESVIHSMVVMKDNSIIAGLSSPDMTIPVQLALTYPDRRESNVLPLDLAMLKSLNFGTLNEELFPCLSLAKRANILGDYSAAVMNSANEVSVKAYLEDRISFYDIPKFIEEAMGKFVGNADFENIEEVFCIDNEVSEYTCKRIYGGKI